MEGVHWCCERGIIPIVVPFSPETGSQFEGFRPPTYAWMMETHHQAAEIIATKLPFTTTEEYWNLDAPICPECFTGGILFDVLREGSGLTNYHCNCLHQDASSLPKQKSVVAEDALYV